MGAMLRVTIAIVLTACSSKSPPAGTPDKPAACTADTDCVVSCENRGTCCAAPCCQTVTTAAAAEATAAYNREHCTADDRAHCPDVGGCPMDSVVVPRCKQGACVAETKPIAHAAPDAVDPAGYDTSCKTVDDCIVVNAHPCDKCGCAQTPIAAKDAARFNAAAAAIRCGPQADPRVCGECMPARVDCVNGRCVTK